MEISAHKYAAGRAALMAHGNAAVMPTRVKRGSFEIDEAEPVLGGRSRCNDASLRDHMHAALRKVNPSSFHRRLTVSQLSAMRIEYHHLGVRSDRAPDVPLT
jgi:hypothetical protein